MSLHVESRASLGKAFAALASHVDRESITPRIEALDAHREQQFARAGALPIRGLEQLKLDAAMRLAVHAERARRISADC